MLYQDEQGNQYKFEPGATRVESMQEHPCAQCGEMSRSWVNREGETVCAWCDAWCMREQEQAK